MTRFHAISRLSTLLKVSIVHVLYKGVHLLVDHPRICGVGLPISYVALICKESLTLRTRMSIFFFLWLVFHNVRNRFC